MGGMADVHGKWAIPFFIKSQRVSPSLRSRLVISGMKTRVTRTPTAPAAAESMNFILSSTCDTQVFSVGPAVLDAVPEVLP